MIKKVVGKNVQYRDDENTLIGRGFLIDGGAIALESCPKCRNENYSAYVLFWICAWRGFHANKD